MKASLWPVPDEVRGWGQRWLEAAAASASSLAAWPGSLASYIARFGLPKPGTAVWIRTCQHIDGFIDVPKVLRFRIPA